MIDIEGVWGGEVDMIGRTQQQPRRRESPDGPDRRSVTFVGAILFGSAVFAGLSLHVWHVVLVSIPPSLLLAWQGAALLGLLLLVGAAILLACLGHPRIGGHMLAGGILAGVIVVSIGIGRRTGISLYHLTAVAAAVALFEVRTGAVYAVASVAAYLLVTVLERILPGIPILSAMQELPLNFIFSPFSALLATSLLILYAARKTTRFAHRLTQAQTEIQAQPQEREVARERLSAMERLLAIGKVLNSTLDMEEVLTLILDKLKEVLLYDSASILLPTPERDSLVVRAARGYAADLAAAFPRLPFADFSLLRLLIENGCSIIIEDTRTDPRWVAPDISSHVQSWLGIPMVARGEVIGALSIDFDQPHSFSPGELITAGAFAEQAAAAVQNARLYQSLERTHEELKKLEQQRAEYYSLVVHDMRSPLAVAIGFIEMLLDPSEGEPLVESQRFMLRQTGEALDRVLGLVNDFLDYSKIEAGYLILETEPVALGALVDETIEEIRAMAAKKGVVILWKAPSPDPIVQGDEKRLRQVVENLVVNAIKYTDKGGAVEVRVGQEGREGRVEVQDTGVGIPPETQPLLFDAYHALTGSKLKRALRGTGLGLFIVKRIVEAHGGAVGLHSTGVPGEGSTFYFTLPLASGED
jgi:signal transduction histidine kinase